MTRDEQGNQNKPSVTLSNPEGSFSQPNRKQEMKVRDTPPHTVMGRSSSPSFTSILKNVRNVLKGVSVSETRECKQLN